MSVAHERALLLRKYAPMEIPWRTHGLLLRVVLFGLTVAGVAAFAWLLDEFDLEWPGTVAAAIALSVAEVLIHARRWWWTGVEEGLWLAATYAAVSDLPSSGRPEAALVLALAAAIPGLRMRNPLFGAVAAIFIVQYFELRFDLGVLSALVIAALAVLALLRTWRRPSTEWLWIAIAIALPVAGRVHADEVWRDLTIILYGAFGAATLFLAIRKRHHALFLSGAIAAAIAGVDLSEKFPFPAEAKLALSGALLLVGSWLLARALKDRKQGFVTTPAKLTEFDDQLELAATISIPQQNFEQRMESGGEFGGAGATGKY
ncbi:MAG TPA: hypothetical protein VEO54_18240 [Thermoanaerobaculia bacterium]|nr:hypothetical protein [Thermoanaerobaculia bacterium]